MALLVTYTFSLDRGISIKLRSGLRVDIVSTFGEDPKQCHCRSPRSVTLGNDFLVPLISLSCATWTLVAESSELKSIGVAAHLSHRSEKSLPLPPLAAAGRTCHREMSSSSRRFSSRSSWQTRSIPANRSLVASSS